MKNDALSILARCAAIGLFCYGLVPFGKGVSPALAAEIKPDWRAEWERTLAAAKKEGEVSIYGPSNRDEQNALVDAFQKAYPNIRVKYVTGRLSELASRIMAERRAEKFIVDILLGSTTTPNRTLKPAGVFQPIHSALILPEILDASAWFKKKLWFGDNEERFLILWRGGSSGSFMINTNLAKREEFSSYWDLLNPKWKGKITAQDPRVTGRGYSTSVFLYYAKDYGPDYLKRLLGEMEIVLSRDSHQIVDWLGQGKFAVALFVGSQGEGDVAIRQGLPITEIEPTKGSGALGTPRTVTFVNGAPHPNAAKIYINWLLSREGQIAYQKATGTNSLRTDIPKNDVNPAEMLRDDRDYIPQNLEKYEEGARPGLKQVFDAVLPQR
ncbi:MAG TPA: extracellular solute-binding protein [Candidatus Binatia bacterium]|jgi:iron(III) transport system substrate-binding protein